MKPVSMTVAGVARFAGAAAASWLPARRQPRQPASPLRPGDRAQRPPHGSSPEGGSVLGHGLGRQADGRHQENVKAFSILIEYRGQVPSSHGATITKVPVGDRLWQPARRRWWRRRLAVRQGEVLDLSELYTKWKGDGWIDAMTDWGRQVALRGQVLATGSSTPAASSQGPL